MWRWSNAADQPDVLAQQHAVAEHVAGHVADADAGEVLLLAVAAERAEVALDRLPGAARGDAHALVVVADASRRRRTRRPARSRAPGRCRWRCRRSVAVPLSAATTRYGSSPSWRTTLAGGTHLAVHAEVVGDVEQAVDEALVAGDALGHPRVAVHRRVRQLLGVEAALACPPARSPCSSPSAPSPGPALRCGSPRGDPTSAGRRAPPGRSAGGCLPRAGRTPRSRGTDAASAGPAPWRCRT